jgi:pyruvate ferredoxin oxidoreductase beta subunit
MAVDSCMFPLYEVVDGMVKVTYKPKEKLPVAEYMKTMGRFRHMFKPENAEFLEQIQVAVDERWRWLLGQDGLTRGLEKAEKEKKAE